MNALLGFLVEHGLVLVIGTTAVLALGVVVMTCQRSPVHRQRVGELTVAAWLVWVVLTCVPLPRMSFDVPYSSASTTSIETPAERIDAATIALPEELIAATVPVDAQRQPAIPVAGVIESDSFAFAPLSSHVASRSTALDWPRVIAGAYVAGVALTACWICLGHVLLRRLMRGAREPEPWLAVMFEQLTPPTGVRLLVSERLSRPMSCGILRPVIVLPSECVERGREGQLRQVLRHELAHVAQRDAVGHALFNLVLPLLYCHPLYWLVRRGTFLARELVADDRAVAGEGDKALYVRELIALAARRLGAGPASARLNVMGIFESTTHFYRRMHMLLQRQAPLATRCSKWWRFTAATAASLVIAGSSLFVGVDRAHAQNFEPRDEDVARLRDERDQLRRQVDELKTMVKEMSQVVEALRKQSADSSAAVKQLTEDQKLAQTTFRDKLTTASETLSRGSDAAAASSVEQRTRLQRQQAADEWAARLQPQTGRREAEAVSHRVQLDLIALANACIEADGNLKLKQVELERINRLVNDKAGSEIELHRAQVELEIAQRKARLFRAMAEAALRGAEAEYQNAKRQVEQGLMPTSAVQEAESKLLVLKLIVSN